MSQCHNMCSKCLPSADTNKRRRLRHSSADLSLRHCRPSVNQSLLPLAHILHLWLVHLLLHTSPDLVINWVQSWVIARPQIWTNESGCLSGKQGIVSPMLCPAERLTIHWQLSGRQKASPAATHHGSRCHAPWHPAQLLAYKPHPLPQQQHVDWFPTLALFQIKYT